MGTAKRAREKNVSFHYRFLICFEFFSKGWTEKKHDKLRGVLLLHYIAQLRIL